MKKPNGRPKKDASERRSETARARVTVAEMEHLQQQTRIAGLPDVSEFIRRRTLGYEVPSPARTSIDPALISELNRLGLALKNHSLQVKSVGNNANQLALSAHTNRRTQMAWEDVSEKVNALGLRSDELLAQVSTILEQVVLHDS